MPSFDIVSEVDLHELRNAVDQANREIGTRFDFKGSNAQCTVKENVVELEAESEFQLDQMRTVVYSKMSKRGVDVLAIEAGKRKAVGQRAVQELTLRQGVDSDTARKIVKLIKESKLKVQSAIQGEQVRVTGKKRDDLQAVMALLREAKLDLPLQYTNFRD